MKFINKIHKIIYPYTPKRFKNKGYKYAFNLFRNRKKHFITFHTRPKQAANVGVWSDELKNLPKFAVVIQGPIMKEDDFTLETVKIYKKIFNKAIIIVSTWDTEDENNIKKIKDENIEVILNKEPEFSGPSHINYQIVSSSAGIRKAFELGAEYVLKTRTDQRIYAINISEFLYSLVKTFPLAKSYKQKERLITSSLNTFKYRMYSPSDMFSFGQVGDMLRYWGPELDLRKDLNINCSTIRDFAKLRICEAYLLTEFSKNIGRELNWTLKDSWQILVDHFCVIDQHSLDLYWNKYERQREYRYLKYGGVLNSQELSFREWLNLYHNLNNRLIIPEEILDTPFRSLVTKPEINKLNIIN
ncbi:MAG: WavE lipopolysaccharide synthesis family protein [Patescibacteria group bacterium]